jgi:pimeloyl-ACP methyl ester carboxylesterase
MYWRTLVSVFVVMLCLIACGAPKPDAKPPLARRVELNGVSISFNEQGAGDTVVLVHGAISDLRSWDAIRAKLASRYHVVTPSNRYFGTASWPDDGKKFSMQTHADDLAALIRLLNVGPVDLVGWSYGADIVLVVAVQHPDLVKSVFVYEPSLNTFVTDSADRQAISADQRQAFGAAFAASQEGNRTAALRPFVDGANGLPGTFDQLPGNFREIMVDNARTLPLQLNAPAPPTIACAQLGEIHAPVAIARGTLTRPFFRIAADTANRCIPDSKLVLLKDGRHLAPLQMPAQFSGAVSAFLAAQQ